MCERPNMGLNLQLSLLLDGLLTAIMAAAFAPKPNISPSLQLESKADARGCTQIIVSDLNLPFHYPTLPVETVEVPQHLNSDPSPINRKRIYRHPHRHLNCLTLRLIDDIES